MTLGAERLTLILSIQSAEADVDRRAEAWPRVPFLRLGLQSVSAVVVGPELDIALARVGSDFEQ